MANSKSAQDIIKGSLQKAGEVTDGSSSYHSLALKYLNNVYKSILCGASEFNLDFGEPWPWARSERVLIIKAPYESGSVSLTNGSTSGTFSSAPSASLGSFVDRYIKIDGRPDYMKIAAHTAGSASFTLDAEYADSDGSGLTFKAIPLIYDLGAGIMRLCEPMRAYRNQGYSIDDDGQVFGIDVNRMRKEYPLHRLKAETPQRFAVLSQNEESYKIQFSSYVLEDTRVDFDLIEVPEELLDTEDSIPVIPFEYREVLEYATAHKICIEKEDQRADLYFKLTNQKLTSMFQSYQKQIQHTSKVRGQLVPREDLYSRRRNLFRGRF